MPHDLIDDLRAAVASLEFEEGLIALPDSLDRPLSAQEAQAMSGSTMFVLMSLSGLLNRRPVLMMEHGGLILLPAAVRRTLLQRTSECTLIIAFRTTRMDDVGANGESAVIIAGRTDVYGWTSMGLFTARNPAVMAAVAKVAADTSEARLAGFDEDDIEEMG